MNTGTSTGPSTGTSSVTIRDVSPRDGLQGESPLPVADRIDLANRLAAAGLPHVEAAAFVSPRAVPSMAAAADVVAGLDSGGTTWWALVPNLRGAELALAAGISHLTITVSASPIYSEKNVGMSVTESVAQVQSICRLAATAGGDTSVDAVVSCAFGSSFGDSVTSRDVAGVCQQLQNAGVDQLTLADTTGTATPRRVQSVVALTGVDVGLHLHDTRGTALTNAYAALQLGVTRFDTAVGGLGGSPFAAGAGGNLATEDLVLLLDDIGVHTGVNLDAVLDVSRRLAELVGRRLPSRVAQAGPLPTFDG